MPVDAAGTIIAIVSIQLGTLTADPSAGAVVRGNGSNLLWISGTAAQVNAKLATLSYTGTTQGMDVLSVSLLSPKGTLTPALRTAVAVIPLAAGSSASDDVVYLDRGTLTLESRTLDGPYREFA